MSHSRKEFLQGIACEATHNSEQEARKVLDQNLQARRDWFIDKFKRAANKKNIPIDDASWYDIANKDAADLVIRSRGKRNSWGQVLNYQFPFLLQILYFQTWPLFHS